MRLLRKSGADETLQALYAEDAHRTPRGDAENWNGNQSKHKVYENSLFIMPLVIMLTIRAIFIMQLLLVAFLIRLFIR